MMCVANIVRAAEPKMGDRIAVIGCGFMGLMILSGLKYQALAGGDIDVTNAYTTDAQLANPGNRVVALEDDKNLQVNYFCSTVVRRDALERFPGLEDALMKLDGALSNGEMAQLNYKVEVEGLDEKDAARDFLTRKGLLNG